MKEEGIDLSKKETNDAFEFFKEGREYDQRPMVLKRRNWRSLGKSEKAYEKRSSPLLMSLREI
jgi:hypothetical protein